MPRSRPTLAARSAEAMAALLAPALPLVVMLFGAAPALPAAAEWLLTLPALLAVLLLRRRSRGRRAAPSMSAINTRTPHGILD